MEEYGYYLRLKEGSLDDKTYYSIDKRLDHEGLAKQRIKLFKRCVPRKAWPRVKADPGQIPNAYHIYKGKCMPCPKNDYVKCTKSHSHEREIIGSSADP
eukprot:9856821-Lingulodinium_polyedra.AAC.1